MDNIKQGFKVCRKGKRRNFYFSARVNVLRSRKHFTKCHTNYKLLKWTIPKKGFGPLAVFKDMESALEFQNKGFSVPELDYTEKIVSCFYRPSERRYLKRRGEKENRNNNGEGFPKGTDFASSVFLIKEQA